MPDPTGSGRDRHLRTPSGLSVAKLAGALDLFFEIARRGSDVRTEIAAGTTTFLTMSYIIFVQPAVISGRMFGIETGIEFGAAMTATCLAAALATGMMALYARAPIAQAPGMGANFFLVLTLIPAAAAAGHANAWQVALGVVFLSGVLFLLVTVTGVRRAVVDAISPSLRAGIASGIGLFIAFIGLQNAGLIVKDPGTAVRLNPHWLSPDLIVFFVGLLVAGSLHARRVRGSILIGILSAASVALALRFGLADLGAASSPGMARLAELTLPTALLARPPDLSATFLAMDLGAALSFTMLPFILIFLLMDLFDTVGTLVGVTEGVGVETERVIPAPARAYLSDAVGTVAGAALGTSTVTSFIESATGVEQGGRTGLTSLTTAALFVAALFASPLVAMVGSYPPIAAPALVLVGAMMLRSTSRIDWGDASESLPAFLIVIGIPLSYSVSDGLALGFVTYSALKILSGRWAELRWPMLATSAVMLAYVVVLRAATG